MGQILVKNTDLLILSFLDTLMHMSAPRFQVEEVRGSVVICGDPLLPSLSQELDRLGLEVTQYSLAELSARASSLPAADSYLLSLTPQTGMYFLGEGSTLWRSLQQYPHPHLYVLEHAWDRSPLETDAHTSRLILGEYVSQGGQGSPTLVSLSNAIQNRSPLHLGAAGLSRLHLMSEAYASSAVALLLSQNFRGPSLHLGNSQGVGFGILAQSLIERGKIANLQYTDNGLVGAVPDSFYQTTHSALASLQPEDSLSLALAALTSITTPNVLHSAPPDSPAPIPSPPQSPVNPSPRRRLPPLKLTEESLPPRPPARNLSNLQFVPAKSSHRHFRFHLPRLRLGGTTRLVLRGMLLGTMFYLGSLVLALGITYTTLQNLAARAAAGAYADLTSNQTARVAGEYLYVNATALGLDEASLLLDTYNQSLTLTQTLTSLSSSLQEIARYILTDENLNIASSLSDARLLVEDLYQQLSLIDGALPPTTPALLSAYQEEYQTLKNLLPELKKQTLVGKGVLSIAPTVLALEDRAKYLVLLQNNMELRGTGGFIGSYGLLSLEKGKLYDFQVFDVYTADGQLKGHVEPPEPIKNILGEAKWYLRDSNLDPDFPTSARRAEWFLKKSMNTDVTGTLALNLETLKTILSALGSIELPDYQETITASNLVERAQFHAEVNFFPGSTAKKEFLSSVADSLLTKLKLTEPTQLLGVSRALLTSLEQNDTQLSVLDLSTENALRTLGWNGAVESKPCPASPCYDDYFFSVESNFGVNKANFYISRALDLEITVDKDGYPTTTTTTTWTNSATSNAWPAGTYKNYHRLYFPSFVVVEQIVLGERQLNPSEYQVSTEHGRTVVSYLVNVPINSTLKSQVTTRSNTSLKPGNHYSLYLQKQSGIRSEDKLTVTFNLPQYLKPTRLSPAPLNSTAQQLIFSYPLDTDHRVSVQF